MLILGIDTSGKDGSLALVRFEDQKQLTLDVAPIAGGTFSAQLIPQLAAMLGQHGLSKRDIDGFAEIVFVEEIALDRHFDPFDRLARFYVLDDAGVGSGGWL